MKIIIALLSVSLIAGGLVYQYQNQEAPALVNSTLYPKPKPIPEFQLTDFNNQDFGNDQFLGKWNIIFFGFTYCPDVCPTTMAALSQVANLLDPKLLKDLQVIFVSVDPERDTPERLKDYVPYYHPDFIAITGDHEPLLKFSMSVGAMYIKVPEEGSYMMSHSSTLFIIDPQGRRFGIINKSPTGAIDVDLVAKDLANLLENY